MRNATCTNCGGSVNNSNVPPLRDDGDGSSSGTNADETIPMNSQFARTLQVIFLSFDLRLSTFLSQEYQKTNHFFPI